VERGNKKAEVIALMKRAKGATPAANVVTVTNNLDPNAELAALTCPPAIE
jgi:hypothetical protein